MTELIKAPRSELSSYAKRVLRAPLYPLRGLGLFTFGATALFLAVLEWLLCGGGLIGWMFLWSIFFGLIGQTSNGATEPDVVEFSDVWNSFVMPTLRAILATSLLWVPAFVYLVWRFSNITEAELEAENVHFIFLGDPVPWLLVLLGLVYMPMTLILAGAGGGLLQMVNPLRVVTYIGRIGRDYLVAVVATVVIWTAYTLISAMMSNASATVGSLVAGLGQNAVKVYAVFVWAHVLGLLIFVKGDTMSLGSAEDYLEPVVPDPTPRGTCSGQASAKAGKSAAEGCRKAASTLLEDFQDADSAIVAAIKNGNFADAFELYGDTITSGLAVLDPSTHLEVGRAAAGTSELDLARTALEAAADLQPNHEVVPRAMVLLARLHGELLGDEAHARGIYEEVMRRYPDTRAAAFVRKRLAG